MASAWRIRRRAELRAISNSEPERLIALYRFVTGMVVCSEPPRCTPFTTMIETVLDNEDRLHVPPFTGNNLGGLPEVPF